MDKVDETIEAICDWIQEELDEYYCDQKNNNILPEMIKSLAMLTSANGHTGRDKGGKSI